MFSFIWDSSVDSNDKKAQELSKYYPKDLRAEQFVEEIRHLSNIRETLLGKVNSLELLNKICEEGRLQNLFPQTCVASRIFISIPVSVSQGEQSFSKLPLVKNCLWGKTAYQLLQCSHWSAIWQENSIMTLLQIRLLQEGQEG